MRRFSVAATLLVATVALLNCQSGSLEEAAPAIDNSTPDRLVESMWAYYAWKAQRAAEQELNEPHEDHRGYMEEVQHELLGNMEKAVAESKRPGRNRILRVEVETPSRAVVVVGEAPRWREAEEEEAIYLLTRGEGGWAIRDITQVCWKCEGAKTVVDYDQQLADMEAGRFGTSPTKTCDVCGGRGWTSRFFPAEEAEE